jgi:hypothetical protein
MLDVINLAEELRHSIETGSDFPIGLTLVYDLETGPPHGPIHLPPLHGPVLEWSRQLRVLRPQPPHNGHGPGGTEPSRAAGVRVDQGIPNRRIIDAIGRFMPEIPFLQSLIFRFRNRRFPGHNSHVDFKQPFEFDVPERPGFTPDDGGSQQAQGRREIGLIGEESLGFESLEYLDPLTGGPRS